MRQRRKRSRVAAADFTNSATYAYRTGNVSFLNTFNEIKHASSSPVKKFTPAAVRTKMPKRSGADEHAAANTAEENEAQRGMEMVLQRMIRHGTASCSMVRCRTRRLLFIAHKGIYSVNDLRGPFHVQ
jgi:hypothetical protein